MSQGYVKLICLPLAGNKTNQYSDADVRANQQAELSGTDNGCEGRAYNNLPYPTERLITP